MKRGTEDLDFFIGDEAIAAANGPGKSTAQGQTHRSLHSQAMASTIPFDMVR